MGNQLIPQEEFQTHTSVDETVGGFQTESPSDSGILTTRTLNINSVSNNDLDRSYNLGETSVITDYDTLLVYINELLIRFDASPKYYQKEDYRHLIKTIVDSLRYLYTDLADVNLDIETIFQHLDDIEIELDTKVDKITGKGLSTNDLTNTLKSYYDLAYQHSLLTNNPHNVTIQQIGAEAAGTAQSLIDDLNLGDIITHDADEFAPALTENENYVTDLEKSNLHAPGSDNQVASDFDIKDLADSTSLRSTWSGKQDALGFTPENISNKKTTLTDSNTDYPTGKAVITALNSYADIVAQELSYKVDKEAGKGLSTEDYTTAEKSKVANIPLNTNDELGLKVDKVTGSSLVPDTEIDKLADYPELLEETTNKVISDTGELVSIPTPSGGYANNLYLGETDSDVAGYKILTYIADTAETIKTVTANSSAGVITAQTFLYPTGVSVSNFPSGLWSLKLWGNISAPGGVSQVGFTYFKRSVAGVETDLFTLWSEEVNNTSDTWIDVIGTQPSYSVDPTDRMGLRLLFKTTSGTNKTLTYSIGDGYAAFVNNPNQIRHSQIRDKNGEEAFQHVDTTTTKSGLDNGDKVALYDSVTGKMVLSDTLTDEYFTKLAEPLYSYGVVFDQNQSTTTLYRIGNQELHRTLPVQSGMKRCLLLDDGTVNYYTHPNNTLLKADGVTASVLDGTDGQLMVEVPEHWRKFTTLIDEKFEVRLSMVEIPGYHKVAKFYVSAFEATVHRPTNKLSSVINLSPDYRGGNNNAAWDGAANTLLGRPASSISLTNFRTYARNRGAKWNVLPYEQYKSVWYLYMVEYANTNVQLPFSAPDPTGLKTGGLGNGVTDANSTEWTNFSGYNPFIPCGASIMPGIGNLSGEKTYTVTNFGGTGVNRTFKVPSYRGIENIFGHIWKHTDGVLIEVKTDADGGTSKLYTQSNPAMFADVITNYTYRGNLARSGVYIKKLLFGTNGDILPTQVGGGSTTYYADSFETNITSSQTRCVLLSAYASKGAAAGLSFAATTYVPASAAASIGARLCYIP